MPRAPTDLLDPDKIRENLETRCVGKKVLVYDRTSSTQTIAAEYARNRGNDGLVIFAEEQTAGRGRAGNKWHSGRSDSILCSIVLTESTLNAELLSLICAVAVAEAVGESARIRWPNDIVLNGKKVAGILLESKSLPISDCRTPISESKMENRRVAASKPKALGMVEPGKAIPKLRLRLPPINPPESGHSTYVVGIGVNCHQERDSFPEALQPVATSMDIEARSVTDRISLARRLLSAIDHWLEIAETNAEEATDRWRELSIQLGHRIALVFNGRQFAGHCIGIDPKKGLILQLDTGGVRMFDAAHTTIAR